MLVVCIVASLLCIPAFATVKEREGDGYALYNGYYMPNIDTVWTDKATYPYAYICQLGPAYTLALLTTDFYVNSSGTLMYWSADGSGEVYNAAINTTTGAVGEWEYERTFTYSKGGWSTGPGVEPHLWQSFQVNTSNGTLYCDKGTSVNLDGFTCYEWDGDTTGLDDVTDVYYYIAPAINPVNAYAVYDGLIYTDFVVEDNGTWTINNFSGTSYVIASSSGIYARKNSDDLFVNFVAVKPAADNGDIEETVITEINISPVDTLKVNRGDTITLTATDQDGNPVNVDWWYNDEYVISTATDSVTYTVPNDAVYDAEYINAAYPADPSLIVSKPFFVCPEILSVFPVSVDMSVGDSVTLTAVDGDGAAVDCYWLLNGEEVVNSTAKSIVSFTATDTMIGLNSLVVFYVYDSDTAITIPVTVTAVDTGDDGDDGDDGDNGDIGDGDDTGDSDSNFSCSCVDGIREAIQDLKTALLSALDKQTVDLLEGIVAKLQPIIDAISNQTETLKSVLNDNTSVLSMNITSASSTVVSSLDENTALTNRYINSAANAIISAIEDNASKSEEEEQLKAESQPLVEELKDVYSEPDENSTVNITAEDVFGLKYITKLITDLIDTGSDIGDLGTIVSHDNTYRWFTAEIAADIDSVGTAPISDGESAYDRLHREFNEIYFPERVGESA